MTSTVGLHATFDGWVARPYVPDEARARALLTALVRALPSVHIIAGPEVVAHEGSLQGWCIIAESHASFHIKPGQTPDYYEAHADVFSCIPFDVSRVLATLRDYLGPEMRVSHLIERRMAPVREQAPSRSDESTAPGEYPPGVAAAYAAPTR